MHSISQPDYQKMYLTLFNAITDATHHIKQQNYGLAMESLICAQQKTEELYLQADE